MAEAVGGRTGMEDMPLEVLEKILTFLTPEETCSTARSICRRFQDAAYNVIRSEFLRLKPLLEEQLEVARRGLGSMIVTVHTFQTEMILVAKFTFLQVLHSEYQILSTIFFQNDSNAHSVIIFKAVRNIKECNDLLIDTSIAELTWRTNISAVIDKLRILNSAVCEDYFWNKWNITENPFGPLFVKLISCAICSTYQITICHEANPKYKNAKCHLHGTQEMPDLSSTLSPLPGGAQNMERSTRILALYVCDSIRWSNVFHSLRLRWTCMDRALVLGRASTPSWPLLSPTESYLRGTGRPVVQEETETELRHNTHRLCRVFRKEGETMDPQNWIGLRSDFRLWCPISEVPEEFFKPRDLSRLPERVETASRPYLFKLLLKVSLRSRRLASLPGREETVVWFEETPEGYIITQSKQQINN